uniref:Uncharacterized protein n=1 Tax=Acrobeloides nanus TaxID=290746 RepID=A0A914CR55_9BILA
MVQKKYLQEYSTVDPSMKNPNLKIPSESEIRYWYEIFQRKGSFENGETDLIEAKLAKEVRKDPSSVDLHTTIYEKEAGILNFFGFKKFHKCHPYKMHLKHQLDKLDLVVRKNFAKVRKLFLMVNFRIIGLVPDQHSLNGQDCLLI